MLNGDLRTAFKGRTVSGQVLRGMGLSPGPGAYRESYEDEWHPVALALSCFVAALLIVSWLFEPGRDLWNQLDLVIFRTLNSTLAWGAAWQSVWAIANWRPFDLVAGAAVFFVLWATVRHAFADRPALGWVSLAVLIAVTLAVKFVTELLIDYTFVYHRPSPTKVLDGTWRLKSLVPWVKCKDTSSWSFPGDHGFVLLMSAIYATYFGNKRLRTSAWLIAIVGILPRLVGGAHWATDIVVGSGTMALVVSAFVFATPLHAWILDRMPRRLMHQSSRPAAPQFIRAA